MEELIKADLARERSRESKRFPHNDELDIISEEISKRIKEGDYKLVVDGVFLFETIKIVREMGYKTECHRTDGTYTTIIRWD